MKIEKCLHNMVLFCVPDDDNDFDENDNVSLKIQCIMAVIRKKSIIVSNQLKQ